MAELLALNPGVVASLLVVMGWGIGVAGLMICRRQPEQSIASFGALLIAGALYTFGYGMELWSQSLAMKLFWLKVQYLGISFLPAFWNLTVIQYVGREYWLTRPVRAVIFLVPVITLVFHYTNAYHQLHYIVRGLVWNGPFLNVDFARGPLYWLYMAYLNLSMLFGNLLLCHYWFRAAAIYRGQITIMMIGSLFPWSAHLVYITGNSPWGLDVAPFAFFATMLAFAWGLYGFRLFTLAPIAREIVFDSISDGILVLDSQHRLVDYNEPARQLFNGLSPAILGTSAAEPIGESSVRLVQQIVTGSPEQQQVRLVRDGESYWYLSKLLTIPDRQGGSKGNILVLHDITRQKSLMEALEISATTDGLTGTYNRDHFMKLSLDEIARANSMREPVSLILIDFDYFKQINDSYGHKAGDSALQTFVNVIRRELRDADLLGRFGGDEFMVFLANTPADLAMQVAERLRAAVAATRITIERAELTITASFGIVALQGIVAGDFDGLFKKADQALYCAKNSGRNSIILVE